MNPDTDFLPPGSEPGLSPDFQENVVARIHQHHRRKQRMLNLVVFCLVLTASFYYRRTRDSLREIPVRQDARVASAAKGVNWLVDAQNTDGSWASGKWGGHPAFADGVSALATLALLNAPDPVNRDVFNNAVRSLENSVLTQQKKSLNGPEFYNRVLTLYTLSEVEKQMPDPRRKSILRNSFDDLLRRQLADGGWGYPDENPMGYVQNTTANSAVTWWVCHLLETRPSLQISGADLALNRGKQWLTERRFPSGKIAYQPEAQVIADKDDALFWMNATSHKQRPSLSVTREDAYRDFFRLAVTREDSELKKIQTQQTENGSWSNPGDRWWQAGGKVYLTAMSVLSQVPKGA